MVSRRERGTCTLQKWYHRIDRVWQAKNQAIREAWSDTGDTPVPCIDTYVRIERASDEIGNAVLEKDFDAQGLSVPCKAGYNEKRRVFDERKLLIEEVYPDARGNPCPCKDRFVQRCQEPVEDDRVLLSGDG